MSEKQVIKAYDKEGVYRALAIDRATTAKDVVVMFVKKLRTQGESADNFRLFVEFPDGSKKKCPDEDIPHKYILDHPEFCKARNMNPAEKQLKFTILQNVEEAPPPSPSASNGRPDAAKPPPPPAAAPVSEEVAGYLKKKKKGPVKAFFESYWVVFRETPVKSLELYESEEQSQSVVKHSLENASFELQASEGELYMVITLSNSEKHIFHSDEDGVIQQWMEALNPVHTLSPHANTATTHVIKSGPFVPSTKDLAQMKKKPQGPKENIEMQVKVLVQWLDYLVTKHDLSVTNLDKDLRDGMVLATILDVLFAKKIKVKQPKSVFEHSENVTTFLDALPQLGISAGKVTASDISENSSPRLLLPLLWTIFFKFVDADKDALLAWAKNYAATRSVSLNGFTSLQDGIALAAIISEFRPELLDYDAVHTKEPLTVITTVKDTANKGLGIPKLFEPRDAEHADEKIWSLYLSFFYLELDQSHQEKWLSFQERREAKNKAKSTPSPSPAAPPPANTPAPTTPVSPTLPKVDKPRPVSAMVKKPAASTPKEAPAKPRPASAKVPPVETEATTSPTPSTTTATATAAAAAATATATTATTTTPSSPTAVTEIEVPRPPETPTSENVILYEKFVGSAIDVRLLWYNPPQTWGISEAGLLVCPDKKTDFWRKTHYGFERDNGHYLYMPTSGNFSVSTRVSWRALHEYDQAGLMIRLNENCWLKTSVEYQVDGPAKLGVVVTNYGYSDWSTQNFTQGSVVTLRVRREGADYFVDYWSTKAPGGWIQMRIAHLFDDDGTSDVLCGAYACSPTDSGYEAVFEYLKIESPPTKQTV